jgi:hypothetical protein
VTACLGGLAQLASPTRHPEMPNIAEIGRQIRIVRLLRGSGADENLVTLKCDDGGPSFDRQADPEI